MSYPVQIARFADERETREVFLLDHGEDGAAIIQYCWGELTQLSYGCAAICQQLSIGKPALALLAGQMGWADGVRAGLERLFADGDIMLSDLLDICESAALPCRFCVTGSDGASIGSSWAACERRRAGFSLVP
jgi:hypothetical protein